MGHDQHGAVASFHSPDKGVRFAQVSLKYELPVTKADKEMMLRQCGG